MSARRKSDRRHMLFEPRRFDHELSAETRHRLAVMIAAHDDPAVAVATYEVMAFEFANHLFTVGDVERREAALQLGQHGARALTGRQDLQAVGWAWPAT